MNPGDWYQIQNAADVDTPALLIYPDRVKQNILSAIGSIEDVKRLRPHVKTHKSLQVSKLMLEAGISKFKCATISEAEMLAVAGAKDILLAYQPIGPKVRRLAALTKEFPDCEFSCVIDNLESASAISAAFLKHDKLIRVYIDLNVGMNRTGIKTQDTFNLIKSCMKLKGITIFGLHIYDGHFRDTDYEVRKNRCDQAYSDVEKLQQDVLEKFNLRLFVVAGGTPTFSIHCKRKGIECSPGTFIYWDKGYEQTLSEQHYNFAAVVMTRVISLPDEKTICIDLGHKSIASENPLNQRIYFLNANDLLPIGHSEEHMVLTCEKEYKVGDILYGIPYHICPTVALHDQVAVVKNQLVKAYWDNISRNRKITI